MLTIFINSKSEQIPDNVDTVGKVLDHLRIKRQGTGIGLNNHLVAAKDWDNTQVKEGDRVMIISAAYGG